MQNLSRVGENDAVYDGPISSPLWIKVHVVLRRCRIPLQLLSANAVDSKMPGVVQIPENRTSLTVLRTNIKLSSFFINICCFGDMYWASLGIFKVHINDQANTSLCICLPNFVKIGPSATELLRHIHFSRWQPGHRNSTSGFGFRDIAHLGRSMLT